jgi:hypothetical protein
MNQRILMSLAAVPVLLVTAVAQAQAPAAPAESPPSAAPPAASAPIPVPVPEPPPPPKAAPPPTGANKFQFTIYGFAQLDIIHDNTSVVPEGAGQTPIPRPPVPNAMGAVTGQAGLNALNGRTQMFGNNSRFGFRLNAPEMNGVKSSAVIEADFMGTTLGTSVPTTPPTESAQNNRNLRLRHAFVKMESDIVDVTAGYTWDVFGGAVVPFLGAGMAFHGILGEVFHRNPQLRLSKTIKTDPINFEVRVAAVRPVQNQAQIPDLQGALRLTANNWKTVHSFGSGLPVVDGLTLEISGMYRFFKLNEFSATPSNGGYVKKNGWGAAADLWLPIIPATKENQANALGLSIQAVTGSGIADMWGVNGGLAAANGAAGALPGFPNVKDAVAADPMAVPPVVAAPAVAYPANIDPGIVAYDRNKNDFVPIKWTGIVAGLQYRLPFEDGRMVLSSNNSYMTSSNISDLAIMGSGYTAANLWKSAIRDDVSLSYTFYPAVVVGAMYETIQTKYVLPGGANMDDKSLRSHRVHFSVLFFF